MNSKEALELAKTLDGPLVSVTVSPSRYDDGLNIVFQGETGTHSLSVEHSDRSRVMAHYEGFLYSQPGRLVLVSAAPELVKMLENHPDVHVASEDAFLVLAKNMAALKAGLDTLSAEIDRKTPHNLKNHGPR